MDSVSSTTGITKVVRKDGVLYSDGTTTLGGDDKVGVAGMLEAVRALKRIMLLMVMCNYSLLSAKEIGRRRCCTSG